MSYANTNVGEVSHPSAQHRQSRIHGLFFGAVLGGIYALAAWGWDGAALARASTTLPWLKLGAGGLAAVLLGAGVGWLVAAIDRGLASLLLWAASGFGLAWLAGRLPSQGLALATGWLEPRARGLDLYPLTEIAAGRAVVAAILAAALFALGGVMQLEVLDRMREAQSRLQRGLTLVICLPFILLAGTITDAVGNRPLRDPQVNIVRLIRIAISPEAAGLDRQERLDLHLGALNAIRPILGEPLQVVLGDYDDFTMSLVNVEIEFEAGWARCTLMDGNPSYCRPSDPIYLDSLSCLGQSGDLTGEACHLTVTTEARQWLAGNLDRVGASPQVEITDRVATAVWIEVVTTNGARFECGFQGGQRVVLEGCAALGSASDSPEP